MPLDNELSLAEAKGLSDALIMYKLVLSSLIRKISNGESITPQYLDMIERGYCSKDCSIESSEIVVRSRKQFDEVACENAVLRKDNEYLKNHIRVAREERDELILKSK